MIGIHDVRFQNGMLQVIGLLLIYSWGNKPFLIALEVSTFNSADFFCLLLISKSFRAVDDIWVGPGPGITAKNKRFTDVQTL